LHDGHTSNIIKRDENRSENKKDSSRGTKCHAIYKCMAFVELKKNLNSLLVKNSIIILTRNLMIFPKSKWKFMNNKLEVWTSYCCNSIRWILERGERLIE